MKIFTDGNGMKRREFATLESPTSAEPQDPQAGPVAKM